MRKPHLANIYFKVPFYKEKIFTGKLIDDDASTRDNNSFPKRIGKTCLHASSGLYGGVWELG